MQDLRPERQFRKRTSAEEISSLRKNHVFMMVNQKWSFTLLKFLF